jgi:acetyl esterase
VIPIEIDSEAAAYLKWMASFGLPSLAEQGVDEVRRQARLRVPMLEGEPEAVDRIEDFSVPGPRGPIRCRLYAPGGGEALPALLYMHGGGWVVGDLDSHDSVCRALSRRAGCIVLSVDYRLAPEHRFPAAVEDAWAALAWFQDNAASIGADPDRIAVGGDSSGGNLAAVIARWSRDRGGPPIAAQVLIYPAVDFNLDSPSYREVGSGYGLTLESMRWYRDQYLSNPGDGASPDASPLRAANLKGLAPALVITCEFDPLASEGTAYAAALSAVGVPVEHIHEKDMIHGYIRMAGVISRSRKSWDDCGHFLRRELQTAEATNEGANIGFRAATHADAGFAAVVSTAAEPNHPQTAEEVREKWANTEAGSKVRRFIVHEGGVDRGWISLIQPRDAGGATTYLNLLIPPDNRHLLPAAAVFGEDQAREMGTSVLVSQVGEDSPYAVEWLRNHGWSLERKQRFWRLDLEAHADRIRDLWVQAHRKLDTTEVVTKTVADLGGDAYLRRLLPVLHATVADIPTSVEYIPQPFEEWLVWMRPPTVLPQRIWVAVVGDQPIGFSYLAYHPSSVWTGFTGVLREHRGKGLARTLKLDTLVQAIDLGVTAVETDNDSENAPILHINEDLGYDEMPGKLEFHRRLTN